MTDKQSNDQLLGEENKVPSRRLVGSSSDDETRVEDVDDNNDDHDDDGRREQQQEEEKYNNHNHSSSKVVFFGTVQVFEFPVTTGDNPSCRDRCPVRMDTECINEYTVDLELFEKSRSPYRRRLQELYLPVPDRACMLLMQGLSLNEIVDTVLGVEEAKRQRGESLRMKNHPWGEKINFAVDKAGRTLRKIIVRPNNNNKNNNNNKKTPLLAKKVNVVAKSA